MGGATCARTTSPIAGLAELPPFSTSPRTPGDAHYRVIPLHLAEPDWRRPSGFADVPEEQWRSAQWQRAHCVKNVRQLRGVYGDLLDESFYADVAADQAGRATMSLLLPPQIPGCLRIGARAGDVLRLPRRGFVCEGAAAGGSQDEQKHQGTPCPKLCKATPCGFSR